MLIGIVRRVGGTGTMARCTGQNRNDGPLYRLGGRQGAVSEWRALIVGSMVTSVVCGCAGARVAGRRVAGRRACGLEASPTRVNVAAAARILLLIDMPPAPSLATHGGTGLVRADLAGKRD